MAASLVPGNLSKIGDQHLVAVCLRMRLGRAVLRDGSTVYFRVDVCLQRTLQLQHTIAGLKCRSGPRVLRADQALKDRNETYPCHR